MENNNKNENNIENTKNYNEDFFEITQLIDELIEYDTDKIIETTTKSNKLHVILKLNVNDDEIFIRVEKGKKDGFKIEKTSLTTLISMYDQWMEWFEQVFDTYIN